MKLLRSWGFRAAATVLLAILCVFLFRINSTEDTDVLKTSAPTAATHPSQTEATEPADAVLIQQLLAELEAYTEAVDGDFLGWVAERFGTQVLSKFREQLRTDGYRQEMWYTVTGNTYHVLMDVYTGTAQTQDNIHLISLGTPGQTNETTTLIFGGDICLADNYLVMEHLRATGGTIEEAIDPALIAQMQNADVAFLNNEFTISDGGEPLPGKYYTFRAQKANTALYRTLGIDIVSLANNHAFDYGESAFLDTLQTLGDYGIAQVGGGRDLEEAMTPQYYIINGRKIAYVAATRAEKYILTPEATENSPGVLRCYDTALFRQVIAQADDNSDFVVACVHWGTEYSYTLEQAQTVSAREYIDAGADLIIGAHAHQLQGIEFYQGKAIFYNLGNFWFNSYEIDTGLVKVELDDSGAVTHTFLPALQKDCVTTSQIGTERGNQILQTLRQYCVNAAIDENGTVTEAAE